MNDQTASPEAVQKATRSYRINQKQWEFLGYTEAIATAVLADFFSMEKLRNPSQKPLNVLEMVGRRRVKEIVEAVKAASEEAAASETTEESDTTTGDQGASTDG